MGLDRDRVQLAWPFAVLGFAAGNQLPSGVLGSITMALVLGLVGALISTAIDQVRDWQVALMAPLLGATTGAGLGFMLDGVDAGAVGIVAGTGFGLLAVPPLVLLAEGARRAHRLGARSLLGRAQRRRIWLLTLAAGALAALVVPALISPWSRPAESVLAQLYAVGTMLLAIADAASWVAAAAPPPARAPRENPRHPYREPGLPTPTPPSLHSRAIAQLAAQSLLYDALLVAIVAAAMLVSA